MHTKKPKKKNKDIGQKKKVTSTRLEIKPPTQNHLLCQSYTWLVVLEPNPFPEQNTTGEPQFDISNRPSQQQVQI